MEDMGSSSQIGEWHTAEPSPGGTGWRRRLCAVVATALGTLVLLVTVPAPATAAAPEPAGLAPRPSAVTASTISVRILRSPSPDRVCKPDIGYEVLGGGFADWHDVGGFPNAPCDDPDLGYKFRGLTAATTYTLSIRAYRIVNGSKQFSTASSITASTAAAP